MSQARNQALELAVALWSGAQENTQPSLQSKRWGEEGIEAFAAMNPLQRMTDPAELGAAAACLTSQDSSSMPASELAVDGAG